MLVPTSLMGEVVLSLLGECSIAALPVIYSNEKHCSSFVSIGAWAQPGDNLCPFAYICRGVSMHGPGVSSYLRQRWREIRTIKLWKLTPIVFDDRLASEALLPMQILSLSYSGGRATDLSHLPVAVAIHFILRAAHP